MLQGIPALMIARTAPDRTPSPNTMDFYRRKEPIIGLLSKVDNKTFDYYRRLEPLTTLILV